MWWFHEGQTMVATTITTTVRKTITTTIAINNADNLDEDSKHAGPGAQVPGALKDPNERLALMQKLQRDTPGAMMPGQRPMGRRAPSGGVYGGRGGGQNSQGGGRAAPPRPHTRGISVVSFPSLLSWPMLAIVQK